MHPPKKYLNIVPKPPSPEGERITSFVHNMSEGDILLLDGKVQINLQETRNGRATLQIKAPKSVLIVRGTKKYP